MVVSYTIICYCFENRSTDFRLLYQFGNGIPIRKALPWRIFAFFEHKSSKKAQKWWISNGRHYSACVLPIFYCCSFLEIGHQGCDADDCRFLTFDFFHSQKKPQKSPKMKKFNFFFKNASVAPFWKWHAKPWRLEQTDFYFWLFLSQKRAKRCPVWAQNSQNSQIG